MAMIAWTRTYSVLLPGIMETFSMSPGQGGKFIATIEGGSFFLYWCWVLRLNGLVLRGWC
jgi:hypothetical protein